MKTDRLNLNNITGSIFVENRSNTIVVQVKGKRKYTGLKDTPYNRKIANRIKEKMYLEINGLTESIVITSKKLSRLFETYISEREITKSKKTIMLDKLVYKNLIRNNINADIKEIEKEIQNYLKTTTITDESKNIYLRQFQTFVNWLHKNAHISERINFKTKYHFKTKTDNNLIFTAEEVNKIIDYFNTSDKEFAIMIKLMVNTGLRINEALTLTFKQVTKDKITLFNKNDKSTEYVILPEEVYNLLMSIKRKDTDKVFRWSENSYSRLNRRLNTAMQLLSIPKENRSFHEFRKTYLYYLFKNGVPVNIAQKLMRHKDIKVTIKFYQRLDNNDLYDAVNKLKGLF